MMDKIESLAQDLVEAGSEHFQIALRPDRVVFWVAGMDGACEMMSKNWSEQTGQSSDQALGIGWLLQVAPIDRQRVADEVRLAVSEHRGFSLHYQIMCSDGRLSSVLHDAAARELPSGQFNGLIATITGESGVSSCEANPVRPAREVYDFLDNVPLASCSVDFSGCVVHANKPLAEQLGCELVNLIGKDWIGMFVSTADRAFVRGLFNGSMSLSALPDEVEYQVHTRHGAKLYRWHLTLIRDTSGHSLSLAMMGHDITRWRALGNQQRLTAQMFDASNDAMVITDRDNHIVLVNASFTRLTGYAREEVVGQNPRILKSGKQDKEFYLRMWQDITTRGYWCGDIWDRRKDGSLYPKFLAITAIRDVRGVTTNYSAIFYDITERKLLEEHLDQLAHHDALTGLPNRTLLQDRLEQAIFGAERQKQHIALLFIDLDGFKPVNDRYGHEAGDKLLQQVGQRLLANIRNMDTAARLGGDEFVVILTDVKQRKNVSLVAEKILEALSSPYDLGEPSGEPVSVSASIGVSIYPNDKRVAKELLHSADHALYRAKREGKRQVVFFGNVG